MKKFFKKYFKKNINSITKVNLVDLSKMVNMIVRTKENSKKIIIVGNGGSAAMASHVAVDFTKCAGVRAINFNEADLLTCFSNDYGYKHWVEKAIEFYADPGDLCILISSSGKSQNIVNGAKAAKKNGLKVVTFSGFSKNNPLKKLGTINFWVNSKVYNIIEMTHHIWLLSIVDYIQENKKLFN